MLASELDFDLPEALVARRPADRRDEARMMRVEPRASAFADARFGELPALLRPGDLLVLNDTRVIPARLLGRRMPDGGKVEALLLRPEPGADAPAWWALVKPGKKVREGDRLVFAPGRLEALAAGYGERGSGERLLRFDVCPGDWWQTLDEVGHTPLPPYILKARLHDTGTPGPELPEDRERYQTVYAGDDRASVAAPTAGLHFTPEVLAECAARGIATCRVQLHVGAGTFQPIKTDRVEDHPMHEEYVRVPAETAERIASTRAAGGRIVAVGTTVVRTLETAALVAAGDPLAQTVFRPETPPPLANHAPPASVAPIAGWTRLYILPGFRFRACDVLLTNFHLPRSSLLLLVEAFAGTPTIRAAYAEAIRRRYRFFSYGDCMLIGA